MKGGTWTTRPVSVLAGLVTLEAVADLSPGSVSTTLQVDGLRQLDPDRLAVEVAHLDLQICGEVLDRIAQRGAIEHGLLVVHRIHEVVIIAVGVEELHGDFVHDHLFDGVGGAEAVLEHGAGFEVAQFGLDEGAKVAGRAVLDFEDRVKLVVMLDDHARAELGGGNRHRCWSSLLILRAMRKGICHLAYLLL